MQESQEHCGVPQGVIQHVFVACIIWESLCSIFCPTCLQTLCRKLTLISDLSVFRFSSPRVVQFSHGDSQIGGFEKILHLFGVGVETRTVNVDVWREHPVYH